KCQEMSKKLTQELESIYKNANISPKKLQDYLSTQSNFSDKEWKALKAKREEIKQKLENLLYKANIKQEEPSKEEKAKGEKEEKTDEKKKLKTGVRKQRWMPM